MASAICIVLPLPIANAAPHGGSLAWAYVSQTPAVPGTLVDGTPGVLQDSFLNSSFVVKVTAGGHPVKNVRIIWKTNDPTAGISVFGPRTDAAGQARMWYFAGQAAEQKITAINQTTGERLDFTLQTTSHPKPTVGRYVATYFDAPSTMDTKGTEQAYAVTITPHTDPTRTYYELITAWQGRDPAEVSFYGGIQNFDCSEDNDTMAPQICAGSRQDLRGHLAIFSEWNTRAANGQTLVPRVANLPATTTCVDFTGEGEGLKCTAAFDWRVNDSIMWKVEKLPGATAPYQRVRSLVSRDGGVSFQEVATFDLPDNPNFTTISPFVENWGGGESPTCLDVALRSMTITSIRFFDGRNWAAPASAAGMGGEYSSSTTRCENYSITTNSGGITINSGGTNNWVNLKPIIKMGAEKLPFGVGFTDTGQVDSQWQRVDLPVTQS